MARAAGSLSDGAGWSSRFSVALGPDCAKPRSALRGGSDAAHLELVAVEEARRRGLRRTMRRPRRPARHVRGEVVWAAGTSGEEPVPLLWGADRLRLCAVAGARWQP